MIRNNDHFVEEYEHFRSFGLSHAGIAERLNMQQKSLVKRAQRLGVYRPEPMEVFAQKVLDRLIMSGEPFSSDAIPCAEDELLARRLVLVAVAEKRLRREGSRLSSGHGQEVGVYVGVETVAA